ncbi:MAG: aminopeptidase [Armatimonadetes bacterium]|nr:aminopeptidase [Armatimonadota bacterium]
MHDPRLDRWAATLATYCAALQPGDRVLIQGSPTAEPLLVPLYRACLEAGAFPSVLVSLPRIFETLIRCGTDAQLSTLSPMEPVISKEYDVSFHLLSEENTRMMNGADPSRQSLFNLARRELRQEAMQRAARGERRWTVTLFPTQAYAQDAGISLSDFEEFIFDACFLNDEDPAERWRELGRSQQRLIDRLEGKETVQILARDTDLTFSIRGRSFINSDGKRNFPSGEFFTGPVEDSVNGHIRYSFPAVFGGREVENVRLWFEEGRVVRATAARNEPFLHEMLGMDDGARRLGEFAFGNNYGIRRFTRNVLLDEKIGGTVHLALGASYPETGGTNESALHWDMVCDLRSPERGGTGDGGEVWVDGQLFSKDGAFSEG